MSQGATGHRFRTSVSSSDPAAAAVVARQTPRRLAAGFVRAAIRMHGTLLLHCSPLLHCSNLAAGSAATAIMRSLKL